MSKFKAKIGEVFLLVYCKAVLNPNKILAIQQG